MPIPLSACGTTGGCGCCCCCWRRRGGIANFGCAILRDATGEDARIASSSLSSSSSDLCGVKKSVCRSAEGRPGVAWMWPLVEVEAVVGSGAGDSSGTAKAESLLRFRGAEDGISEEDEGTWSASIVCL